MNMAKTIGFCPHSAWVHITCNGPGTNRPHPKVSLQEPLAIWSVCFPACPFIITCVSMYSHAEGCSLDMDVVKVKLREVGTPVLFL